MKKILIPENAGDLRAIEDAVQQCCDHEDDPKRKNTSMEGVFIRPNIDPAAGDWSRWTVIDNRNHECFTEDFETLDGALIYATDIRVTSEKQADWDVDGNFIKELSQCLVAKKPDETEEDRVITDPLQYWIPDGLPNGGDHDALVSKFVGSVLENVNKHHTVQYLEENHPNGDGTYETEYLVRITFLNCDGAAMREISNALESMTGRDWRRACSTYVKRRLIVGGEIPEHFRDPLPDARVTFDYYEDNDNDDAVKTATLVWAVSEDTWKVLNPASKLMNCRKVADAECMACGRKIVMEWNDSLEKGSYAYCPYCGSRNLKLK